MYFDLMLIIYSIKLQAYSAIAKCKHDNLVNGTIVNISGKLYLITGKNYFSEFQISKSIDYSDTFKFRSYFSSINVS